MFNGVVLIGGVVLLTLVVLTSIAAATVSGIGVMTVVSGMVFGGDIVVGWASNLVWRPGGGPGGGGGYLPNQPCTGRWLAMVAARWRWISNTVAVYDLVERLRLLDKVVYRRRWAS